MKDNSVNQNLHQLASFNIAHICSYISVTIGALVLVGWQFDIGFFKRISDTFIAMNPMTAVGFIFPVSRFIILYHVLQSQEYFLYL